VEKKANWTLKVYKGELREKAEKMRWGHSI